MVLYFLSYNFTTKADSLNLQVHIKVSKRTIKFSNAPSVFPMEQMRDRLELSFSKPSRGGGEVEKLEYDPSTETGYITFVKTGGLVTYV